MKICNCTLPYVSGPDVCKNCGNHFMYQPYTKSERLDSIFDFPNLNRGEVLAIEDIKNS